MSNSVTPPKCEHGYELDEGGDPTYCPECCAGYSEPKKCACDGRVWLGGYDICSACRGLR